MNDYITCLEYNNDVAEGVIEIQDEPFINGNSDDENHSDEEQNEQKTQEETNKTNEEEEES